MQLEQAGFRISRALLKPIPKFVLIVVTLIILVIFAINLILMFSTKPSLKFSQCLQKYYELTHENLTSFIQQQAHKNKTGLTVDELNVLFKYLNSSTLLKFQTSKQLQQNSQCIIQLNYNPSQVKNIQQNGISIPAYETLGYMMSNYPLFNLNITDKQLIAKHNINLNRIIIPPFNSGFRYFGMDILTNKIQDFLYSVTIQFDQFHKNIRSKWAKHLSDIITEVKKQSDKEKIKAQEKQKNKTNDSTKPIDETNSSSAIEPNPNKKTEIKVLTQQIANKQNPKQIRMLEIMVKQTANSNTIADQQVNKTKQQSVLKLLQKKYMVAANLLLASSSRSFCSNHRMMYRYSYEGKWQPMQFDSYPKEHNRNFAFKIIGKIFFSFLVFGTLLFDFIIIGMLVRYLFITVLTLISVICYKKLKKVISWMHRYTDLMQDTEQRKLNRKIICQIGFAIVGMYGLYALVSYLLMTTCEMGMIGLLILPSHPSYVNKLFNTFIIIQIFHYLFFRTRTTLAYFYKFSLASTLFSLLLISYNPFLFTTAIINAHFIINMALIVCFLFVQKMISEDQFESGHRPTLQKPRMLFYLGFDLDWHKSIPPIWTQFQAWYDISFANQQQKSYIDQNYELLYGRLMGVNEPQQLPDEDDDNQESASLRHVQMSQNSD